MNSWIETISWLIPAVPMLAAVIIGAAFISGYNRGEKGEAFTTRLSYTAALIVLTLVILVDFSAIITSAPGAVHIAQWFHSGTYQVNISFNLDTLALAMMTLISIISALMIKFSVNYMHREAGYQRFFMILNQFFSAMLLIVMSGNLILTFTGWELAGVCSYLLIAYAYDRPAAVHNATRVFITNRIGDAGFILAIFLCFYFFNTLEWADLLSNTDALSSFNLSLLLTTFILAAMVKSAQVPFSPWILRALEGPTPSSAIFYGSLMVHAGVYLLLRLEPFLLQSGYAMNLLIIIGILTMLYSYLCNFVQTDVKSNLIFSTTAQVGLMFFSCGMGWFGLAAVHLVIHAIWRAYQFLLSPSMMHLMDNRKTPPVNRILQTNSWLYMAALQRFWLDQLANWIIVKPLKSTAADVERFDQKVVNRLVGLPAKNMAISSLSDWEAQKNNQHFQAGKKEQITRGYGLAGKIMQGIADVLYWFEEQLVLKSSGDGLLKLLRLIGHYLLHIDDLLSRPRYLVLLIAITFVVII